MNGHFGTLLTSGIENLVAEFNPPTSTMGQNEEDKLHLQAGFQKKKGLRDGIDAADQLWMSIGSTQVAMPRGSSSHNIRQKDINALSQLGGDVEVLRQPGPKRDQVRRLCEVLAEGVGPKKYSAQDGELLILLLGHFAWFSHSHAREIIEFGGHTAIVDWLRTDRFKGQSNPLDDTLAFPLHRACLSALASICRHGIDTSNHLLELDGVELALEFATHLEAGVRCAALRLLARLIPYAAKRHPQKDSLPLHIMWPILLAELQSGDELLRTVAAACSLEAIATACVPVDGNVSQNLALALLHALELATASDSSATALPLLIAVNRMAADEDEGICTAMRNNENLIPLLTLPCTMPIFQDPTVATDWLPKATKPMAVATAKASGLSAACTLRLLSEAGAALDGSELAPLLRYGTSIRAEIQLQEACQAAIESAVHREQDAGLLIQMLTNRWKSESPPGICGYSVMIRVAQRATAIIKQDPDQASEAWLELLEHSIDTVLLDLADSKDMLEVLEELRSVTRKIISIRNGELEDEVEGEDAPDEREEEDPEEGERVATS
ncbi:Putative LRR receptor-like serine/threonine-protein kinase [Durusdinium trenchii]|uniref:LRR receptor-like serine/threonine-protein kinase n=1 Tax=Durusdinium trenchii TaxID=1381693 RepID=A0ABP0KN40_9DINO